VVLAEQAPEAAQARLVAPAGSRAHLAVSVQAAAQGLEHPADLGPDPEVAAGVADSRAHQAVVRDLEHPVVDLGLDPEAAAGVVDSRAHRAVAQGLEHPAVDLGLDPEVVAGVADSRAHRAAAQGLERLVVDLRLDHGVAGEPADLAVHPVAAALPDRAEDQAAATGWTLSVGRPAAPLGLVRPTVPLGANRPAAMVVRAHTAEALA